MPDSDITGGQMPGMIFENRAGWRVRSDDFDKAFDDVADAVLARFASITTRGGVITGYTPTANPGDVGNVVSVSGGSAIDYMGQYIYKSTSTSVSVAAADAGKYICLYYEETEGESRASIVMGTVAYMYTYSSPTMSVVTNPTVGDTIRLAYITSVDPATGAIVLNTDVGITDSAGNNRDEWMHYHPYQSIDIEAVRSSSVSSEEGTPLEDDMLSIPLPTRETLLDELNGIKSVLNEMWTGGNRYAGGWDDVNSTAGAPGIPTTVVVTAGPMSDLRYNYSD